jgi:hypothetical protein
MPEFALVFLCISDGRGDIDIVALLVWINYNTDTKAFVCFNIPLGKFAGIYFHTSLSAVSWEDTIC